MNTGKTQAEPVTAVLVHHDTDLYDLTVKTNHGTAVIHTTASHLIWDPSLNKFLPASNLKPGAHLKTPDGKAAIVVGGSVPADHNGWMWDLTVPGNNDHDFYVTAGSAAVLVHNCSSGAGELESGYDEPTELHHVLPQQFRGYFARAGINIDDATAELPQSVHQAAHDVGWNSEWQGFINANPSATVAQITDQASRMMWEFGLDKFVISIAPY